MLMVKAMQTKVGNSTRKLILAKLADNANDQGECWPSYKYIAEHCETSRRSVMSHIKELEKIGLLRIERRIGPKGNSSNVFHLTLDGKKKSDANGNHTPSENSAPPSENSAPPPSENISPRTSHSLEPVNEPKDTLSEMDSDAAEVLEYLNEVSNQKMKTTTKSHMGHIKARLRDGHTVEDCKRVIEFKHRDWLGTEYYQYMVPRTIFSPAKFDGYLTGAKLETEMMAYQR